ncbi:angiopoietin-related protein 2 [Acipenser ruthenus]|uniref:angiopoietin-related protein 2 n=1 Tax=Acipenser ruthenus TaxID=7906 RepID=UPI0015614380|nr:angiopoietin-related protein 2 [Acipenser ruthenus]
MERQTVIVALILFTFSSVVSPDGGIKKEAKSKTEHYRHPRSPEPTTQSTQPTGKCSYTFIVPQQKITGAICLSTRNPEDSSAVNKTELEDLRLELSQQQRQIEHLKQLVEVDGSLLNEVKFLRKESRNMNSRVTQLYTQLLHEIIQKKDQALEATQLENRLLNATAQVLRVSANYRELETKYEALASLLNNHSLAIAHLEKRCQLGANAVPTHGTQTQQSYVLPPQVQVVPLSPVSTQNRSQNQGESSNEIQRDQTDKQTQESRQWQAVEPPPASSINTPTEHPFFSSAETKTPGPWRDCRHVLAEGGSASGIYLIRPRNVNRLLQLWCEQSHADGGWAVIQRRQDGSVNFFRTWEHYKQGFGNIDGEYWLGLENLYWLTTQEDYKLLVLMEDWQGQQVHAEYDSFRVEPESDSYRLRLGHYQGDAGDSLSWHNNKAFTTLDRDRDAYTGNCAHYQKGGWWYHMCAHSNLNGVWYKGGHYRSRYQDGVYWAEFRGGSYSLKKVTMMIKPIQHRGLD